MGAKARYVPILIRWAGGDTYHRLYDKFGYAGLVAWVNFLLACKQNDPEGQIEYLNEADGWHKLSLGPPLTPEFTLAEFFRVTGRLKKTHKRRVGQRTHVVCTRWSEHNKPWQSQQRDERNPSTDEDSARNLNGGSPEDERSRALSRAEAGVDTGSSAGQNRSEGDPTALPDETNELHRLGADLERRLALAPAPRGSVERLLEVIPPEHCDSNTYETLRRALDPLSVQSTEDLRDELEAAGPDVRNLAKYAVKIAQRMLAERGAA